MSETTRNILTSEEKATLKRLKTGWKYALIPVIFTVAWVFGEALFGTEPADSFLRLVDSAYIVCSVWIVVLAVPLNANGRKIQALAKAETCSFSAINSLLDKRRMIFIAMIILPLIFLITKGILPYDTQVQLNMANRNTLAMLWFMLFGRNGFKECDKYIPIFEKLGKI